MCSILLILSCTNTGINNAPKTNNQKENQVSLIDTSSKSNNYYEIIDGWLKVFIKQQEVVGKIGKPDTKEEDEYWGATGTYVQIWKFTTLGIILEMESENQGGDKIVRSITIIQPCKLTTSQGISIGSDAKIVLERYQKFIDKSNTDKNGIIVGSIYGGTIFTLKDGVVSQIFIGAAAE